MKHCPANNQLGPDQAALDREATMLRRPIGRRRDSSIVGIYDDALRHKDGALTVAYYVEMPATMFADDMLVDVLYDDLARMLAFEKPPGTVVQFRFSTIPDSGQAINCNRVTRAGRDTHVGIFTAIVKSRLPQQCR
jgi:hypothetical protein